MKSAEHDAIVVGAGAAGGLAALFLAEAGLRVLVLNAGQHDGWNRLLMRRIERAARRSSLGAFAMETRRRRRQPIQSKCYAWTGAPWAFVDDLDCPYTTPDDKPYVWIRSRQLGGRMVVPDHGRQQYRLGPDDFAPIDGLSPAWPLHRSELDIWYSIVERRLQLSGANDGLPHLPDSDLAQFVQPTSAEIALRNIILGRWPAASAIQGRYSAPPGSIETALKTGRVTIQQGAVVREIEVRGGRVKGVAWIDERTRAEHHNHGPLVFLCASALESTRVLLLSRTPSRPGGLGAESGVLGHNLMDHVVLWAKGTGPAIAHDHALAKGRCLFLPRFDARERQGCFPGRGFGVQLYHWPEGERTGFDLAAFGEMLPRPQNCVVLDPHKKDAWGIPVLRIECSHGPEEDRLAREQTEALRELADVLDITLHRLDKKPAVPGTAMHECGTARMGNDPATSVLDPSNQCWEAQGLFVTDGACFPSQGFQNPTLTILALTARACERALDGAPPQCDPALHGEYVFAGR